MLGYISIGYLLLDERSSSLTLYLVESIIKKFCWVFFPMRVSQDKLLSESVRFETFPAITRSDRHVYMHKSNLLKHSEIINQSLSK